MHPYLKQYIETLMCGCLLKHTAIFCSAAQFASQWKAVTGGGTLSLFHCLSKSPQCSKPAGCTLMIRIPLQRWDFFKLFFFLFGFLLMFPEGIEKVSRWWDSSTMGHWCVSSCAQQGGGVNAALDTLFPAVPLHLSLLLRGVSKAISVERVRWSLCSFEDLLGLTSSAE